MSEIETLATNILRGIILVEFGDNVTPGVERLGDRIDLALETLPFDQYQRILAISEAATEEQVKEYARIYWLQDMLDIRFRKMSYMAQVGT